MTLIICEKDNAAKRIAEILSKKKFKTETVSKVSYYTYTEKGKDTVVIGLRGHILNLDYPEKYNQWEKVNPKDLIHISPTKQVTVNSLVTIIKKLAKSETNCIIATDYDREGELIGVEGLEIIKEGNPDIKAKRARFSSLTPSEIEAAFKSLTEIDYNLSASAETRQLIDLAWGASLTRFVSMASGRVGRDFLSVGRVQSPTLSLVVDKEKEISAFVSKPYWEIEIDLACGNGETLTAKHVEDRFWDKKEAQAVFDRLKDAATATVKAINSKERSEAPPAPFNTTSFLRAATNLGLTAASAMNIAEDLYTQGLISYPRTDNTVYPPTQNLREILEALTGGEFRELAEKLLAKKELIATKGKKSATDHPPIHPVALALKKDLDSNHWKIYELVVRRFMATLADPFQNLFVEALFTTNPDDFRATGVTVINPGWTEFYQYGDDKERKLPDLEVGKALDIEDRKMMDKDTKPPKRFSQGSLIQEMDRLGLGTKSTRHEIIQKLYDRGYITGQPPEPTLMGLAIAEALEKFAEPISKPDMTSKLESDMDLIANGERKQDAVVTESQGMLDDVFAVLDKNRNFIGLSIKEALKKQNTIGKCPWCAHDMIVTKSRWGKRFASCSFYPQCRNSYPLPQKGRIEVTGLACPRCRSPVIRLLSKGKKPWEICINMNCPSKEVVNGANKVPADPPVANAA